MKRLLKKLAHPLVRAAVWAGIAVSAAVDDSAWIALGFGVLSGIALAEWILDPRGRRKT